jgi:hypothetical protein
LGCDQPGHERAERSRRKRADRRGPCGCPFIKWGDEVSDIAEAIVDALQPDDEDERRDVIEEDYQLESDIETFEQLTGKVIARCSSSSL